MMLCWPIREVGVVSLLSVEHAKLHTLTEGTGEDR